MQKRMACVLMAAFSGLAAAQDGRNVLVVVNDASPVSRTIGDYYARRRPVPAANLCHIRTTTGELIARDDYNRQIAAPIAAFLHKGKLEEQILYIVTTLGVPLKIATTAGTGADVDGAAVDSELTLLYLDRVRRAAHPVRGSLPNPFFARKSAAFTHPQFPIYLVTRLAAYDFDGVKGMIDRSLLARNTGVFVIDERDAGEADGGDRWLHEAAIFLPKDRVVEDATKHVLSGIRNVIGYASWGSNDRSRHMRFTGFQWLPGAIATEFVSTNARTFRKPPDSWIPSMDWGNPAGQFAGGPQSMSADYILEGATGASGHVDEPFLAQTPRPDLLLPAYYRGRNLAESYYLAIRSLSWQNIVLGDPLCSLGKP